MGFFDAMLNPFLNAGNFFLAMAVFAAGLATLTLRHVLGYMTFFAVMISDFAFGAPLPIFTCHLAVAILFAEGTSSLGMYESAARHLAGGGSESASENLRECFQRFRRTFIKISVPLLGLSVAYGFLPEIIPTPTDLTGLAIYATIGLMAIALTVLYLGSRE